MPNYIGDTSSSTWPNIQARIPPSLMKELKDRHPEPGKRAKVLRALVQMYMRGKISNLEFISIEKI